MLKAMIVVVLGTAVSLLLVTQIILPLFVSELRLFWLFTKGSRDDIVIPQAETPYDDLNDKAQEAKEQYKNVKNIIKTQKKKLDRIDKASEL
ncbi:MAG: hypothetical protein R2800_11170 [Flavipsychrobacter sp.]